MNRQSLNFIFNFLFLVAVVLIIIAAFGITRTLFVSVFGTEHEALVIRTWIETVKPSNYYDSNDYEQSYINHIELVTYQDVEKTQYKDSVLLFKEDSKEAQMKKPLDRLDAMFERIRKSEKSIQLPASIKRYYIHNLPDTVNRSLYVGKVIVVKIKGDRVMLKSEKMVSKNNFVLLCTGASLIIMVLLMRSFLVNKKRKDTKLI